MAKPDDGPEWAKTSVAVLLTFIAGYVDAIGWLSLDRVFTAQMSGNVVLLAIHLATGADARAALQATILLMFFLGLVLSGGVIELGMRWHFRRILAVALLIELVLLIAFTVAGSGWAVAGSAEKAHPALPVYLLGAVLALAMGAQNTALRMAGILTVYTTHVTGTLTALSEEIVICAFTLFARPKRRWHGGFVSTALRTRHPVALVNLRRSVGLILGFFGGALGGALLLQTWEFGPAMLVPLALLCGIAAFDWLVPLTHFPSAAETKL